MKNHKLKFLIPVLAIIFAVASAFTTSARAEVDDSASMIGYINSPSPCTAVSVDCTPIENNNLCTYQGQFVYDKLTPTICNQPLYRNQ
ncbi:DUF6520 family protein [Flagellimonas marina]|uniref:DUF6520 family protein n=1 Tax=Flagellimonas marina TaxID=1775168 RepID=A0ABV8PK56_9FLAO